MTGTWVDRWAEENFRKACGMKAKGGGGAVVVNIVSGQTSIYLPWQTKHHVMQAERVLWLTFHQPQGIRILPWVKAPHPHSAADKGALARSTNATDCYCGDGYPTPGAKRCLLKQQTCESPPQALASAKHKPSLQCSRHPSTNVHAVARCLSPPSHSPTYLMG